MKIITLPNYYVLECRESEIKTWRIVFTNDYGNKAWFIFHND